MKKLIMSTTILMAAATLAGAPVIKASSVTMTQDASREVTISYTLEEEPAVVTVDIRTNNVSIGGKNLWYFRGAVNTLVQPGERTVKWRADKAWPGHKIESGVTAVVTAWATNTPPDYMVVSLVAERTVRFYADADSVPFGVTNDLYKTEMIVMRKCPAANVEWRMGSPSSELARIEDRETPRLVTLADDYYIGIYPVTQRQFEFVLKNERPSYHKLDADYATRPVENVSYYSWRGSAYLWPDKGHQVNEDYSKLGAFRRLTGIKFDLPTEAQWEFACRAGCGAALYSGKELEAATGPSQNVGELARYQGNAGADAEYCKADEAGTAKVGSFHPNAWGIYDMLGNVYEMCLDWYLIDATDSDVETGPVAGNAMDRVRRGGSYLSPANLCRSAFRSNYSQDKGASDLGARLVCPAVVGE